MHAPAFSPAPPRPKPNEVDFAILRSVIYASLFEFPLTVPELRRSLLGATQDEAQIVRRYRASRALQSVVAFEAGHFFPQGRQDLVQKRQWREQQSVRLLKQHRSTLKLIASLPSTRLVALSGSIAHLNVNGRGDIDLFIVTRGRRVWAVTVAALLISKACRSRREVCLNFVISDRQLAARQRDLFTANQIIHLKPLIGDEVFCDLVDRNAFVFDFYPNFFPSAGAHPERAARGETPASHPLAPGILLRAAKRAVELVLAPGPGWIAEGICRAVYRRYLRRQATTWRSPEQVALEDEYLKLHTHSHRASVLERFERETERALAQLARP